MEKLARVPVERRRHGAPAGHEKNVLRGDERALRSHAREGRRIVRLLDELRAGAVVHPRHLTRLGVHRVNERAHERPDARGEIHAPITQHRAAARGPGRDDALVAEHLAVGRPAAQLPLQRPVLCAHAVEMPVVAGEIDFALPRDRREAHRAVRVKCPEFLPRPQVERHHLICVVEADEDALAHHHRLEDAVIRHQVVVERIIPHLHARRILPGPLQMQLGGQLFGRGSGAVRVGTPHRPVGCVRGQGEQQGKQSGQPGKVEASVHQAQRAPAQTHEAGISFGVELLTSSPARGRGWAADPSSGPRARSRFR